jgi:hypothetical protein
MATPNPPDYLLIAASYTIRKAIRTIAATTTHTLILEFNPIQEEAAPSRRRNLWVGALLYTTRAFKATVLGQEIP